MWGFSVAKPGKPVGMFSAGWDPEPDVYREQLDLSLFEGIATPDEIEPLLALDGEYRTDAIA